MEDTPQAHPDRTPDILRWTALTRPPLVPEIRLHLATAVTPLWEATERTLETEGLPPPYWAFAWPGGQALARHILDHPELVRGRSVVDFAAGSGLGAIAAALAGARRVLATEIDAFALAAMALNASANGVQFACTARDVIDDPLDGCDVVLCGDVCYERPMAGRVTPWLRRLAGAGRLVLLGDPGRSYLPGSGLERLACHRVPTSRDLEDGDHKMTDVLRLLPG